MPSSCFRRRTFYFSHNSFSQPCLYSLNILFVPPNKKSVQKAACVIYEVCRGASDEVPACPQRLGKPRTASYFLKLLGRKYREVRRVALPAIPELFAVAKRFVIGTVHIRTKHTIAEVATFGRLSAATLAGSVAYLLFGFNRASSFAPTKSPHSEGMLAIRNFSTKRLIQARNVT